MDTRSLSPADTLRMLRDDIQAEDTLIASRMTWYVTTQAFLLTAYATSWNAGFVWPVFFHRFVPVAAILLSVVIQASVYAATWAQDMYIRTQVELLAKVRASLTLSPSEALALDAYEQTTVPRRRTKDGRLLGPRVHALVRLTPLVLPVGFTLLWAYAFFVAPG